MKARELETWEKKLIEHYPGVIFDKSLVDMDLDSQVPRYVSEYLLQRFHKRNRAKRTHRSFRHFLERFLPEPRERHAVIHRLTRKGSLKAIDHYKVEVDVKTGEHFVHIPRLGIHDARIDPDLAGDYERLLIDGIWGMGHLVWDGENVFVEKFVPIQVQGIDLPAFIEGRRYFTTEEWITVLVSSLGLNPDAYTPRQRLILLARMIPLVEDRVNIMELAPTQTGKTHLYIHISYHATLISAGTVTPAYLFGSNVGYGREGLLARTDCIVFDEITNTRPANPQELIGKLKNYMESGHYDRGKVRGQSTASFVFQGNYDSVDPNTMRPTSPYHLSCLPTEFEDSALLDRFHGYLSGWDMPKIHPEAISRSYGFISDYLCEVLHQFKRRSYMDLITKRLDITAQGAKITLRDVKSIRKLTAGFVKLLFPNGKFTDEELIMIAELAAEFRLNMLGQLNLRDRGNFPNKKLVVSVT